ncbi:glycosyltransferase [Pseudomonas gozinkensis]|uniref:glycosyltransferase n=1 Tax=Pseudomonas gozinkensis TaxID=2774461 RepID=UPI0017884E58|nr:glycosyltransferase [Pseudomonas gozinkensis]
MESLYFAVLLNILGGFVIFFRFYFKEISDLFWACTWLASSMLAALLVWSITGEAVDVATLLVGGLLVGSCIRLLVPYFKLFGIGLLMCRFSMPIALVLFIDGVLETVQFPMVLWGVWYSIVLMFLLLSAVTLIGEALLDLSVFTLNYPRRDGAIKYIESDDGSFYPKVSIHVPCYAEPPDLVIATLDAIDKLNYDNYEVIVVDNNTQDPDLWRPVAEHCKKLGERYCFFHVDPLSGAKAGAVNFALRHTSPDSEIIAVIDADYLTDADFLNRYVPLFKEKTTAFVQTSHDYRDWRDNPFLSGTYFHYIVSHKTMHPALSEYGTGYLVGTMCLIRRHLVEQVGGWAEWALTEDLELSMSIMAHGYTGYVFSDTLGVGLIPETMDGVKKQQFRWWAGANQEFIYNWRRYLGISPCEHLTWVQRAFRFYAVLKDMMSASLFIFDSLIVIVCVYLVLNKMVVIVPGALLAAIASSSGMALLIGWIGVRELGGRKIKDYFLMGMMKSALRWVGIKAVFIPFLKLKMTWVRTDKFKQSSSFHRALSSSFVETVIALAYLMAGSVMYLFADFRRFDFLALVSLWWLLQGVSFTCTFIMAVVSEMALVGQQFTPELEVVEEKQ